jgi:hypothetical protein
MFLTTKNTGVINCSDDMHLPIGYAFVVDNTGAFVINSQGYFIIARV